MEVEITIKRTWIVDAEQDDEAIIEGILDDFPEFTNGASWLIERKPEAE